MVEAINPHFGAIFREMRKQKKLSIYDLERQSGISHSTINKFENGKTMIKFDNLVGLLTAMRVSISEYSYFLNDFNSSYPEDLLARIDRALIEQNPEKLKLLATEAEQEGFMLMSFAARSCYSQLTNEEQEMVTDYLYEVEQWGFFEISIFYFTIDSLSEREILHIMEGFWDKNKRFLKIFKYRCRVIQSICRASVKLTARGAKASSYKILRHELPTPVYDLYLHNLKNLAQAYYDFKFVDAEKGKKAILRAINLFDELDSQELGNYYRTRFSLLIKMKL